ncbi:MAG TPA: 50S ribosomal protein L4, partial [Cyclobacteriaceae bacterium]|nr:50S ribosomal protein L4 [Cyclobacteriaceae bacterium]
NLTGRKVNLASEVFGIEPNDHAIWLDVKSFLANQRQGTHKSKQRNEISGSSKKLKKQKGTGGARAGNIKNPQFKGGGRVFGPIPRDYSFKLNKKVKDLARKSALTYKAKDNMIAVVEDFNFEAPKTKQFINLIKALSLQDKKTLFVLPDANKNVVLSGRNIQNSKIVTADQINTYDVMNAEQVILVESSLTKIDNLLNKQ